MIRIRIPVRKPESCCGRRTAWRKFLGTNYIPIRFRCNFEYPCSCAQRSSGAAAISSTIGSAKPFLVRSTALRYAWQVSQASTRIPVASRCSPPRSRDRQSVETPTPPGKMSTSTNASLRPPAGGVRPGRACDGKMGNANGGVRQDSWRHENVRIRHRAEEMPVPEILPAIRRTIRSCSNWHPAARTATRATTVADLAPRPQVAPDPAFRQLTETARSWPGFPATREGRSSFPLRRQ